MKFWIPGLVLTLSLVIGVSGDNERRMALQDCVAYGLEHNLVLHNSRIDRSVAMARREGLDGFYEPRLDAELSYTDSGIRDGASFILQDRQVTSGAISLGQGYRSGTRASLTLAHNHIEAGGDIGAFLTEPYSTSAMLSLSQSLLRNAFGELDRARTTMADEAVMAAEHAHERQRRILAADVAMRYWQLYSAERNLASGLDSLQRAEALVETYRRREDDGLIDETDLLATEALVAQRRVDVLSLSNAVAAATDALCNQIQLPPEEWAQVRFVFPEGDAAVRLAAPVAACPETARVRATAQREDLRALQRLEAVAAADVEVRRSEFRHELELFGQVAQGASDADFTGSWEPEDSGWTVGVQFGMGWGRTAERKALEEATLEWRRAQNNRRALEAVIATECRMAAREVTYQLKRISETATVRDLQQRKLALEQVKFEQGRSAVNWLLQYEDDYAVARVAHNLAVANYQMAVASFRLATGAMP